MLELNRQTKTFIAVFTLVAATLFVLNNIVQRDPIESWTTAGILFLISMAFWAWLLSESDDADVDAEEDGAALVVAETEAETLSQAQEWIISKELIAEIEREAAATEPTVPAAVNVTPVDVDIAAEDATVDAITDETGDDVETDEPTEESTGEESDAPVSAEAEFVENVIEAEQEAEKAPEALDEPTPSVPVEPASDVAVEPEILEDAPGDEPTPNLDEEPITEVPLPVVEEAAPDMGTALDGDEPKTGVDDVPQPVPETATEPEPVEEAFIDEEDAAAEAIIAEAADEPVPAGVKEEEVVLPVVEEPVEPTPTTEEALALDAVDVEEEPDDLTRIEGIGPKYRDTLMDAGVTTFEQIAAMSQADFENMASEAGMRRAASMATWAEQAKFAAAGDWEGLDKLQEELTGGRRD